MNEQTERTLILCRHGKASTDEADDHGRPLKRRGAQDTKAIGKWLVENDLQPGLTWVSDARRTWQSHQNIVSQLHAPCDSIADRSLYLANALELADQIATVPSRITTLLVIGHNPGLENLASSLSEQPIRLKSGAFAVLRVRGTWRDLIPARVELVNVMRGRDLAE